ncbi:SpoIID/LytB domain-containing protein [Anaerobacillus alkaliphilus]|uniref:SpoIID/LytB domain-containing protein n=1 Tax=Anaerobacillus alkaliphilus TaxID=1548597 RepID=A0A4Q0VVS5_9BACI|nr:SpoIID/LytB domain-containing protein [Anaerobacillus alkaliphilus]RXJ02539.1 SpoIID/LytB domain-containing protein [Anaerobacillus alkaliphilus]
MKFQKSLRVMLVFVLCFSFILPQVSGAELTSTEPNVRIGVVPDAKSIKIGSNSAFTISDKATGEELFTGLKSEVDVTLISTADIKTNNWLQTAYSGSQVYIDNWLALADLHGFTTYLEPHPTLNGYRLLIGGLPSDATTEEKNNFRQDVISKGLANSDSFWRLITTTEGETILKISNNTTEVYTSNPVTIVSPNGLVKMGGKQYRGSGEVGFNSGGTLAGINIVALDDYVQGVVPHELPPVPFGGIAAVEAQKAQAVAARTYALNNLGKHNTNGYDLLPTTADQVYGGYDAEHPISTQAVRETAGIVATYEGKLITTVYHSTSGGYTANNEDIWNSPAVPYLRGVPDAERGKAAANVPSLTVFKNHSNPTSLRAAKEGDFEADWSRYHRWTYEWSAEEISEVISTRFNTDVGKVLEINVLERSDSGRVFEIEFVTENGTFSEKKDRIRWALQYINASGNQSPLWSTLFFIEPVIERKSKEVTGFKVYGGGWGHGIGMSQTGAVGMAVKGATYEEILKHYYQGIDLELYY